MKLSGNLPAWGYTEMIQMKKTKTNKQTNKQINNFLNHLGIPPGKFSNSLVNIELDLALK